MSRQRSSIVHEFYCTQCGERGIPVYRKYGQFRKVGHLKKLYCLSCGKETNHAECISASKYDSNMFFEEYKSGKSDYYLRKDKRITNEQKNTQSAGCS